MGLQGFAHGVPRSVHALVEQRVLDGDQQVVGQHTEKDVRFHPTLQVVENRSLAERALHVTEGIFGAREQDVEPPGFLGAQVGAIGAEQIRAVELLRPLVLLGVHLVAERFVLGVVGDPIVSGDAWVAFFAAARWLPRSPAP